MRKNTRTGRRAAGKKSSGLLAAKKLAAREITLLTGERVARHRAEAADLRDDADLLRGKERARMESHLREANERLVVALVRAQTMADTAAQALERLAHMAEHDVLTGLPNRALLTDRLTQAIAFAQRHGKKVGLMYLDIDHFKHINDSLGHLIGDQLLQSTAKRLQACVRHSDTVSRQGGDEFVVLLAEVEAEHDAILSAEKLIEAMLKPHLIGSHSLHVTLSIGISLYPDDSKDVEALLKNADTAMYHAKRSGRSNYQRFTPNMNAHERERQSVEAILRHGLDQGDFVLHYQPKVNLETGAITGAEALVRLKNDHQLVFPTAFVGIAEDSGLIVPIGQWVLREACRQMAAWLKSGLAIGLVAVNVSSVEFHSKGFLASVLSILDDSGLDPHCLELELTESGLMQDTEMTMATLRALKEAGIRIAIDDFGTGYSSLSYLRRLPLDTLKIDQSFVRDLDVDQAIIGAIIAMGRSLKLQVIAEGVETPQQLAFLQANLCPEGQGYHFSRPLAAGEFATLLAGARH
ncbi:MAG: EAL domain-containing protein [Rhodocyclaceae bacterium]